MKGTFIALVLSIFSHTRGHSSVPSVSSNMPNEMIFFQNEIECALIRDTQRFISIHVCSGGLNGSRNSDVVVKKIQSFLWQKVS